MKQKSSKSENVTLTDLKFALLEFKNDLRIEFKEEFKKYRDENMTRLDEVMGELQAIREDNTIGTYHTRELREEVDDHEKRIQILEKTHH